VADHSAIKWTDATWQVASGCSPVSAGCRHCYSARLAGTRLKHHPRCTGLTRQAEDGRHVWTGEVRLHPDQLDVPLRWRKGRRIFVGDRTDLFHDSIPDEFIDRVWAVMALTPQHVFQVLTKRPERMRAYLRDDRTPYRIARRCVDRLIDRSAPAYATGDTWPVVSLGDDPDWPDDITLKTWPLPNVWAGVSIEDQQTADARITHLLATPAAVRWVSAEPLLGVVDLTDIGTVAVYGNYNALTGRFIGYGNDTEVSGYAFRRLDWVVCGGESGPNARPMHPDWARSLRDQCAAAGVPFMFKQWGEWCPTDHLPGQRRDWMIVGSHGDVDIPDDRSPMDQDGEVAMERVGKAAAGRLLDGVEHNGMPQAGG